MVSGCSAALGPCTACAQLQEEDDSKGSGKAGCSLLVSSDWALFPLSYFLSLNIAETYMSLIPHHGHMGRELKLHLFRR